MQADTADISSVADANTPQQGEVNVVSADDSTADVKPPLVNVTSTTSISTAAKKDAKKIYALLSEIQVLLLLFSYQYFSLICSVPRCDGKDSHMNLQHTKDNKYVNSCFSC